MLTPEQQATLQADVLADNALNQLPHTADSAYAIAVAYGIAVVDFIVWKTAVTRDEIMQNGFDWTRLDNLTVGKARIWEQMFTNQSFATNPSKLNVRAGIEEVWKGTAQDLAVRAAVYVHCRRPANRLEKLFATGTGTDASPATMTVEGSIGYIDVLNSMGW